MIKLTVCSKNWVIINLFFSNIVFTKNCPDTIFSTANSVPMGDVMSGRHGTEFITIIQYGG